MNKQIKFILFTCTAIVGLAFFSCQDKSNTKDSDKPDTEVLNEDEPDVNGDLSTLNVKVVRKTRNDDVIETDSCNDSLCYVVSGQASGSFVYVSFCTDNTSAASQQGTFKFIINQTDTLTKTINSVPHGRSSNSYDTDTVTITGPINSVSVEVNDEGASPLSLCSN